MVTQGATVSKIDLANLLSQQIEETKINRTQLAKQANISRQTLYKLLNAEIEEAKLSTLIKLSHALKLHPVDLMRVFFSASNLNTNQPDNTGFIGDITYPDNSLVSPNQVFTKTWAVKNTGNVVWENRKLVCMDDRITVEKKHGEDFHVTMERGLTPSTTEINIPTTQPNETLEISVEFTAPNYPCTAISYWKSVDENGNFHFPEKEGLSCLVNVVAF